MNTLKKYYHASKSKQFELKPFKKSRYSIPALFFTSNIALLKLYQKENQGATIEIIEPPIDLIIDFKNKPSYSAEFRNAIYKFYQQNHSVVLFQNVMDYPSQKNKQFIISDILVIYRTAIITNYKALHF